MGPTHLESMYCTPQSNSYTLLAAHPNPNPHPHPTPTLCSYLVLFLKFIASVVPTIEYDYTMAAGAQ